MYITEPEAVPYTYYGDETNMKLFMKKAKRNKGFSHTKELTQYPI